MKKIPPEVLYVHLIPGGIEDFLKEEGFQVFTGMVSQIREARLPFNVYYGAKKEEKPLIMFALQFKRPFP